MSEKYAVGIDLGTTYSSVGWIKMESYESHDSTFPSAVKYKEDGSYLVGVAAIGSKDKGHPIIDAKRFIGKKDKDLKGYNLNVYPSCIGSRDGEILFKIKFDKKSKFISPKQVSTDILKFIQNTFSSYIDASEGFLIKDVVITVPAYFSTNQRKETREAGEKAGFNVLRLINEPTAAAVAYIYNNNSNKTVDLNDKTILVYDFGGGTFDVSIIEVKGRDIYVKGTGGDDHLGGQDITNNIMKFAIDEYEQSTGEKFELKSNALAKLRKRCEEAKINLLSLNNEAVVDVKDEEIEVSVSKFKDINLSLFARTVEVVRNTINEAKLKESDIDYIILVGGSSRIKCLQEYLNKEFNKIKILNNKNSDEIVAEGATYYANNIINGFDDDSEKGYKIHDIITHSIGIEGETDIDDKRIFKPLIEKGSYLPVSKSFTFYNSDYADKAIIAIYEGEEYYAKNNIKLGEFCISIPSKPKDSLEINIELNVNLSGELNVIVSVNGNPTTFSLKI